MAKHMREAAPSGRGRWLPWLLVVLWALFIWSRSLFSGPESSAQSSAVVEVVEPAFNAVGVTDEDLMTFIVRKSAHFSEYAALGVLLAWAHVAGGRRSRGSRGGIPWVQALIGIAVAATDESIQLFVPGRSGQPTDVLIDSCGMLCGLVIATFVIRARRRSAAQ